MKRGQLWWADLTDPAGSEPGFRRPVLIVQADSYNQSKLGTVVVASVTSNLRLRTMPGNLMIPALGSGLPRPSVANITQLSALDKRNLTEPIGELQPDLLPLLDNGLRLVLDL